MKINKLSFDDIPNQFDIIPMNELHAIKGGSVYQTAYGSFYSFSDFAAYMGQMPDSTTLISSLNSSSAYDGSSSSAITYVTKDENGLVVGGNFSSEMTQYFQNNIENLGAGIYVPNPDYGLGDTSTPWFYFPTNDTAPVDPRQNGYCYFYALYDAAQMIGSYSCSFGNTWQDFKNEYSRTYTNEFMGADIIQNGQIVDTTFPGVTNVTKYRQFISSNFDKSKQLYYDNATEIVGNINMGNPVFGALHIGDSQSIAFHEVILKSYNYTTHKLTYWDPILQTESEANFGDFHVDFFMAVAGANGSFYGQ